MSPDRPAAGLLPSVFDRLIDPASAGAPGAPGYSLAALVESVRRDLEDLLNSRRVQVPELDRFAELSNSVYAYGMPELVSQPGGPERQLESVRRLLAEAVARNEPRLRDVRVALLDPGTGAGHSVHFRIEGRLRLEPAPGVEFETVLEMSTGRVSVRSERR